mgnify:CR=1 FL=1
MVLLSDNYLDFQSNLAFEIPINEKNQNGSEEILNSSLNTISNMNTESQLVHNFQFQADVSINKRRKIEKKDKKGAKERKEIQRQDATEPCKSQKHLKKAKKNKIPPLTLPVAREIKSKAVWNYTSVIISTPEDIDYIYYNGFFGKILVENSEVQQNSGLFLFIFYFFLLNLTLFSFYSRISRSI